MMPRNIHDFIIHVWESEHFIISVVLMPNHGGVQFTGPVLEDGLANSTHSIMDIGYA